MFGKIMTLKKHLNQIPQIMKSIEQVRFSIGVQQAAAIRAGGEREFQVFSQAGEDGIIQWLIQNIAIRNKRFIECGASNYVESNTRFLLMHDDWSGFIMDGSEDNITYVRSDEICWRHDLHTATAFITAENINDLIRDNGFAGEVGLLSIDIDGNDYWVWNAINCVQPDIIICEYNSRLGCERAITIPYDPKFHVSRAHYSCLYYGASIKALTHLARKKGYALVYGNKFGSNLFFVRRELLNDVVCEKTIEECYVRAKFREARDSNGNLALLTIEEEEKILDGMLFIDVLDMH